MLRGSFRSARPAALSAVLAGVGVLRRSGSPASRRWHVALAAVAIGYTAVQLVVTARIGLGWDESVYASQIAHGVPAADFSAPRARGVPLLLTPVAWFTSSVTAIRVYLSVLSGAGLFVAYLPWLRLRNGPVVPLAAALFAGLWLSLFYGNEAMPNLWVALSGVAGAGLFCLGTRERPGGLVPAGLVAAFAVASLVRPTDASWLSLPLVVHGLAHRRFRTALAVAGGVAIGWAEWSAEAFLRYGGPIARLHAAGAANETGLHLTLAAHLRALDGPLLCRYGSQCGGYPVAHVAWFAALPVLASLGVWAARRSRSAPGPGVALASGLSLGGSYVLTVGYAAPRFLLPAYALVALPVAEGLARLARPRLGKPLIAVALAGYFTVQAVTLTHWARYEVDTRGRDSAALSGLRGLGVRSPCLLYGFDAVQIGYLAGCSSRGIISRYGGAAVPASIKAALARHEWVGVITNRRRIPAAFLTSWTRTALPLGRSGTWYAYRPAD
ncbi:hypothetical protein N5079_05700 [Planotetraspora sp. A-T 1434]|uniref:hypothetical protein n=1 Tax=Planotetraspora sp. A-T 1434 TaxID=2979219 RepID=UPI0021BF5D72|nr:hypothetical protein [Planotetraspora sp. A-T 1434]MCT9929713.1 hypothetical protein [Planotetraspora sp. A-T 1434]